MKEEKIILKSIFDKFGLMLFIVMTIIVLTTHPQNLSEWGEWSFYICIWVISIFYYVFPEIMYIFKGKNYLWKKS